MRKSKKFVFFWFSPAKRKIVRPEVHVEIGGGMTRVLEDAGWEVDSELPSWSTEFRNRRAIAGLTGAYLLAIWALSISPIQLGWAHYLAMTIVLIGVLGVLNFSLRSIFDIPTEKLDERLFALRNKYSHGAFQIFGLLLVLVIGSLEIFNLDPARMWLPALATYASIPYLLMAWQEKHFS